MARLSDSEVASVHSSVLMGLPPEIMGTAMKLGELAKVLGKYGLRHCGRRTLYVWATSGMTHRKTGKVIRLATNRIGRAYESTVIDYLQFQESFRTPRNSG